MKAEDEQKVNQVILLLSNKTTKELINNYKAISRATEKKGDTFLLYHLNDAKLPAEIKDLPHFVFTDNVLTKLNYTPISNSLIPGNNHFPLLEFYLNNPIYDYYWCIEDDVRFTGDWQYFFNSFARVNKDFISSYVSVYFENIRWPWWPSLVHPSILIPNENRIKSFNPIYRISRKALDFIHNALINHWSGHHEVLLPTLLYQSGYEIMDFGGTGRFVIPGNENKFYINKTTNTEGPSDGTMRWRPIFKSQGKIKNKLYHPVKE
ncbi:DUF3405 domain-containing protein [Fulvivirgaceae bacterium BMA12]|uniref:DUF3405 domain-containing protein n=1 Tax=Agaribacillus aureus TaxID=3051825 RepID=A0ABT8LDV1_9BACT|nr:DUF3405 domain-containing protein [Fulvivirgaceae bacterium BMA12]